MFLYDFIYKLHRLIYSISHLIPNFLQWLKELCHRPTKPEKLDPLKVPKYVNQLEKPPVYKPFIIKDKRKDRKDESLAYYYPVDVSQFRQQLLPKGFPKTKVWGYGGLIEKGRCRLRKYYRCFPGPTFEAKRGIETKVHWYNRLKGRHMFPVDPTLPWANPNSMPMEPPHPWPDYPPGFPKAQKPVPIVPHLHGGEVSPESDGHPEAWFTYNCKHGPKYKTRIYTYPNRQEPTMLWYHDQALGIARLNVYAGLAGMYLLREGKDFKHDCFCKEKDLKLPGGKYEVPLIIQDRMFCTDGSLFFPNQGNNPKIHPYWSVDTYGDIILVNGKAWPNLVVERKQYRLRILNGSNARFYQLKFSNDMSFIQIGTDGGFLPKPVTIASLLLAPGERADLLVDFSALEPGSQIKLLNTANAPYPDGEAPNPETVGQIMQFTVSMKDCKPEKPHKLPKRLNCIPDLQPDAPARIITLNEVMGPKGPSIFLLNGQQYRAETLEKPRVGSTEEWWIVNLTSKTTPIHLHLVQFLLLVRYEMDIEEFKADWDSKNGKLPLRHPTKVTPVIPYLKGCPIEPEDNEKGWKDTLRIPPKQLTKIIVRFAPQSLPVSFVHPGEDYYPFDATCDPGYVWQSAILDYSDNEMMRPLKIEP